MPSTNTRNSSSNRHSGLFGYYPFGMQMQGRDFAGGMGYRWGFGGHEVINTIDRKNIYYFGDFGLDVRLSRRMNIDPILRFGISNYSILSNSPIMMVDPTGKTDYYNTKGKWIGSDGIMNNQKQMVLTVETQKYIKQATKKGSNIQLNTKGAINDIIDLPQGNEILAMDKAYAQSATSNREVGFVTGLLLAGGFPKFIELTEGASESKWRVSDAYDKLGFPASYDAHVHVPTLTYKKSQFENDGQFEIQNYGASYDDINGFNTTSELYGNTQANIILGYNTPTRINDFDENILNSALANPETPVVLSTRYEKVINFYNSTGNIGSMSYDKFKKSVNRATYHNQQDDKIKKCQ
jgi:hypothetical protein